MENLIRILLIENAAEDLELIRSELTKTGTLFEVREAADWDAFLAGLEEFRPHLVLSDYSFDSFDGLSALAVVRERRPDVPFIFVSWEIHEDSLLEALQKGATDYVMKNQLSRLPLSVFRALREARERSELFSAQQQVHEQERLRALGQMASGIAHDFGNTLTPVLGFTEILLNHPEYLDDKTVLQEYLQIMNTAARDAMNIVGRLREFYRKRQKTETFLPLDLKQIVEQAVLLTRPKWKNQALANGAVIKVDTELEGLPKIHGNDTALREILTNLIFNAVDAMPRGGTLTLHASATPTHVHLDVSDTGIGMDEETRLHCFEPFFSTKGKAGTGLGLAMVYGVIKRHDGEIGVESREGKGTCFKIRFPVYRESGSSEVQGGPAGAAAGARDRALHILLVDDEPMAREVVRQYLTGDGHIVTAVSDARAGIDAFRAGSYDLVVTDWAMPGISAEFMISEIKKTAPRTPIVVVTGFGDLAKSKSRHMAPVDFIVSKPPTLLSIREAVHSAVSKYDT